MFGAKMPPAWSSHPSSPFGEDRTLVESRQPIVDIELEDLREDSLNEIANKSKTIHGSLLDVQLLLEAFPSLLLSAAGLLLAGCVLDMAQHWRVFSGISELFILTPVLLNLKGNLEIGLASRLSTAANLGGDFEDPEGRWKLLLGNVCLVQFHAITAGLLVGLVSLGLGELVHDSWNTGWERMLLLASSMSTAAISSLCTSSLTIGLILLTRSLQINPDNIATPLASSVGDFFTILILSLISAGLYALGESCWWVVGAVLLVCLIVDMAALMQCWGNEHVRGLVFSGTLPLALAAGCSSLSGLIFERSVSKQPQLALITPFTNGMCGNLVSIYASRLTTCLYSKATEPHHRTRLTLFLISLPIQTAFVVFVVRGSKSAWTFLPSYLVVSSMHVGLMLLLARWLISKTWKQSIDPDTFTLPVITAVSDVLGTFLIVGAFHYLNNNTQ